MAFAIDFHTLPIPDCVLLLSLIKSLIKPPVSFQQMVRAGTGKEISYLPNSGT